MENQQLRVVHLSIEDSYGAGRAAIRINNALKKVGVDSKVYVLRKNEMADSYALSLSRLDRIKIRIATKMNNISLKKYHNHGYFHEDLYGIDLMKCPEVKNADLIHFHWINEGIWSRSFVKSLIKSQKPVVWTMHDMWPFTGGCHYDEFCERYIKTCGGCRVLNSSLEKDDAYVAQKRKKKYLANLNIQLIGCSNWITAQANDSYIGKVIRRKAVCIPNPIDAEKFKLYDKELCKKILGINSKKQLILFGAVNAATDKRKGAKYLKDAINMLSRDEYMLGVFGSKKDDLEIEGFESISFGRISDDFHLALIYNSADIFVAPSLQENLANTVMESLACGTPVVAFKIGGMSDMIVHLKNGYLAREFDSNDLAEGIKFASTIGQNREAIHKSVMERFSEDIIGKRYLEIYKKI